MFKCKKFLLAALTPPALALALMIFSGQAEAGLAGPKALDAWLGFDGALLTNHALLADQGQSDALSPVADRRGRRDNDRYDDRRGRRDNDRYDDRRDDRRNQNYNRGPKKQNSWAKNPPRRDGRRDNDRDNRRDNRRDDRRERRDRR
jgi:hypothetical protein